MSLLFLGLVVLVVMEGKGVVGVWMGGGGGPGGRGIFGFRFEK